MKYKLLGAIRNIKSRKPKFMKSSYLKSKIAFFLFEREFEKFKKSFKKEETERVLVISQEALGDNLVKVTSLKILAERYGKENLFIMCRDRWTSVFEKLGYNVIGLTKNKNPFKDAKYKIQFFKSLNLLNFKKIILFEHIGIGDILKYLICDDKIGMCREASSPYMNKAIEIDDDKTYVLDRQILFMNELMQKKFTRDDIRPDMTELFPDREYNDIISIGIGASWEKKMLPIENMSEILKMFVKRYPNKKLILLGNGKKQEAYGADLIKAVGSENVESSVGKLSLMETLRVINDSDFFLGYDSGLSNAAFSLRKKYICLFWTEMSVWQHPFDDLRIIKGDSKNPKNDGYHGTDILNSIKVEQIEQALNELGL